MRGAAAGFGEPQTPNMRTADLVINGALVETKLCVYGKVRFILSNCPWEREKMFVYFANPFSSCLRGKVKSSC